MKLADYRLLAKQINADLEAVLEKNGFKVKRLNTSIDESLGILRLSIECADKNFKAADGSETSPERERYKQSARYIGLKPEWLDQVFSIGGSVYKITGLKQRGKKCVCVRHEVDASARVIDPESVIRAFAAKGDARVS